MYAMPTSAACQPKPPPPPPTDPVARQSDRPTL